MHANLRIRFRPAVSVAFLGMAFCFFAITGRLFAQGTGLCTIHGRVSGPEGRPVEVEVKLREITRTVVNSTISDSNGEFTFQAVADGRYYVTVESDLYQHAEVSANVEWGINSWANVAVFLSPLPRTKQSGDRADSKFTTVQELLGKFPKKAVKEYEKGNEQLKRGEDGAAILSYKKALSLAPSMYLALNGLGNAYLRASRLSEAESAFLDALAADPGGAEPCINLGHLYYESKRYDQAEKFLLQGLKHAPDSAMAYFFLGSTYARLGRAQEAEANLQKALGQNDPTVAIAHLELANLYLQENRRENARTQLEDYLAIQPQDPQADHIRQTLARLKKQPDQPQ